MTSAFASVATRTEPASLETDPTTLVRQHAMLLRDVRRRTAPVLALSAARTWPDAELRTLICFVRAAVLRQMSDEEHLLFPGGGSPAPIAELTDDHAYLHALIARLDEAARRADSLPSVSSLVAELLTALQRHFADEEAVLTALWGGEDQVPATGSAPPGRRPASAPDTVDIVLALDTMPMEQVAQLAIDRVLRLAPGARAEVRSSNAADLRRIRRWLQAYDGAGFGFSQDEAGPRQWRLRITRRPTD